VALVERLPDRGVERFLERGCQVRTRQRRFGLADDDPRRRGVGFIGDGAAVLFDECRDLALGHPPQLADERDAFANERGQRLGGSFFRSHRWFIVGEEIEGGFVGHGEGL
jgi:hypothetical protein